MTPLTKKLREQITLDWNKLFPELATYKPMRLLRRCGPLLTGICLYPGSGGSDYIPLTHIHCLARKCDGISLSMPQRLRTLRTNAEEWIPVKSHATRWQEASERLRQQSLLPLTGPITLDQVTTAFRRFLSEYPEGRYDLGLHQDWLLTLAWSGRHDEARRLLMEFEHKLSEWPKSIMEEDGGAHAWLEKMAGEVSNTESARRIVEEESTRHKIQALPTVDAFSWLT